MKKILLLLLLTVGCQGKQGSKGDQGPIVNANTEVLVGNINNNDFTVFDPQIAQATQVTVYINNGGSYAQLPVSLPAIG